MACYRESSALNATRAGTTWRYLRIMTTYKGPATYLVEDGRKFDAEADLTEHSPGDWRGTLTFHDVSLIPTLLTLPDGHIVIGNQSGEVIRQSAAGWSPTAGGPLVTRVLGSGPAPF